MRISRTAAMKLLWPERGSLFAIVGGAIGLSGDITSFFSEFLSPYYLLALFGFVAFVSALLCLQRAHLAETVKNESLDDVIKCGVCDAMRFSLFSLGAFILLLCVGQGQTATEALGQKLGLIHSDVQQIQHDVSAVRQEVGVVGGNVADIHAVIQAQKIIENPKTGEEFFANAWTYSYAQRNTAKALESLEGLYERFSPRKMDAADLYFNSARPVFGRDDLIKKMVDLGQRINDATLVVVAARNAITEEQSQALYEQARKMDTDLPFAYWDLQRISSAPNVGDMPSKKAATERQVKDIEKYISLISNHPAGHYFYLPQYQPDFEMLARQNLTSYQTMLDSLNKMIELQRSQKR